MTEEGAEPVGAGGDPPDPVVEKGRAISIVWLIPIVALVVGGYVAYDAIQNRGVPIVIELPTAEWIEAGKTKIRYLSVEFGSVDSVVIEPDLGGVELHCTIDRSSAVHLTEGTEFWVVRPRLGAGGVSGLGTLLSGAYLAVRPGPADGKPVRRFKGLTDPPLTADDAPGLKIVLHGEELYGLGSGAPVYYRDTQVGSVENHELDADGSGVLIHVYFPPEHAALVRDDSRFWNAGGIEVSGSLAKLDVSTESLASILAGGIAFDSPGGEKAAAAKKGAKFWLHPSRGELESYPMRYGGLRVYVEGPRLGSLEIGDPVSYRQIPVGAVASQELRNDSRHVRIGLNIQPRYASLVRSNTVFWNASGITATLGLKGLEVHTGSLESILVGGVAFATPDPPGVAVKAGSIFRLHGEVKDEWLAWAPLIWRGPPGEAPPQAHGKQGGGVEAKVKAFFHHEGKDEAASRRDAETNPDPAQHGAREEKRHGWFYRKFHHGD